MAITTYSSTWNDTTKSYTLGAPTVTYVGRVLRVFQRDYRAMSDVYTLATFAEVVEDDGTIKEHLVNANFECDVSGGRAEADANMAALAVKAAWDALQEVKRQELQAARAKQLADEEKNRPVPGKKMKVIRGRKVPVGHIGTVAYVHSNGGVLLKADHEWRDRKANGVWVDRTYLVAV